jgi:hypothetical protein
MTVTWVCGVCGTAVAGDAYDPHCPTCGDDTISIPATHFQPEPEPRPQLASPEQRAYIRGCYKHHGLHSTAWCLADLSQRIGRQITMLDQVTAAEARLVLPQLQEWSYGA